MTDSSNTKGRNRFRIIAGQWRGRKLTFPGDVETLRPTTDRIRETLFNWLQPKIAGARCLDLFAGSGALSFEACSREAVSVTTIDSSPGVAKSIRDNCRLLGCDNMDVIQADCTNWLSQHSGHDHYDIVFLDPPYGDELLPQCCRLLENSTLLAPGCIIYLESDSPLADMEFPPTWQLLKTSKAGRVYFGICERITDPDNALSGNG